MAEPKDRTLEVELRRGADALALLKVPEFLHQWQALEQRCPWATVYQSAPFARTWYEAYREVYDPILVFARDESALHGLFLLAQGCEDQELVHAGSSHAEYQAWLATPDRSGEFVAEAGVALGQLGASKLRLHFAAPKLPLDDLSNWPRSAVHVHMHDRGLMAVDEGSTARASLRKKGNRSKLARLGREGPVSLVQLRSSAELLEVIDQIADYCDLRQGAINHTTPFQSDPLKREFTLALMDEPDLLHATVLMAGSTLVAAHLGPVDKSYVSLGVITHSPFAARHSPGKLLLHLLAERLGQQGYRVFDLTPGGEYKARFASEKDRVPTVNLFFSRWSYLRHRTVRGAVGGAKTLSQAVGIDPRATVDRLRPKTRLAARAAKSPHRAGLSLARRASRWVRDSGEFRIYRMTSEEALKLDAGGAELKVNSVANLLQYVPATASDPTKTEFLSEALRRLESGLTLFSYAEDGLLLHHSWLIACTEEAGSEFGHRYGFAEPAAVLWNGYTHPAARGRGLHQASIRMRAKYVATEQLAPSITAGVRSNNGPSRHNIEKLGFEWVGSAWFTKRFGKSERWLEGSFLEPLPAE